MQYETWLKCEIGPGQFSEEYSVSGETADGVGFSMFVPEQFVELDDPGRSRGFVRVAVLQRSNELCLVKLPRRTLENGETVAVHCSQLRDSHLCQKA